MDPFMSNRKKFIIFLTVCFTIMLVTYLRTFFNMPGELTLFEGEEYVYDFKSPFLVSIKPNKIGVVKLNNGEFNKKGSYFTLSNQIMIETKKKGEVSLDIKILGLIPLRTMKVDIVPNKKVVVCGNAIGVRLKIDGVLVVGMSEVETVEGKKVLPVTDSGIKTGDIITGINKEKIQEIGQLIKEVNICNGKKVLIKYKHGDLYKQSYVQPIKSSDDNMYHLGLWVRESSAGIGTLTFYDPDTKSFGALGHGITDVDTGSLMSIESGDILESRILTIKKGKQGFPGELRGAFIEGFENLGNIQKNCESGIYGILNEASIKKFDFETYPIALRDQITEGSATILSNIEGNTVEKYAAEILKVSRYNGSESKCMVIKVTDKKLLDATGGIVQGMSGSPIIQNGRIVGAITHVLINDPSRGYGIFIENMIKNIVTQNQLEQDKAS